MCDKFARQVAEEVKINTFSISGDPETRCSHYGPRNFLLKKKVIMPVGFLIKVSVSNWKSNSQRNRTLKRLK